MKQCFKCNKLKPLNNFNKNKKTKDGLSPYCKECQSEYMKEWRKNNLEHRKEYQKRYREENKEEIAAKEKEYRKQYNLENKERISEWHKQYYQENKEMITARVKVYREKNKGIIATKNKLYYENKKEDFKKKHREYYEKNKEKMSEQHKQRYSENKEMNLNKISELLEQINPLFKEMKLPIYGYIYKFENIKTGRVYIGQTIKPLKERYKSNIIRGWIKDRKRKTRQKFKEELIAKDIVYTEFLDVACCSYHLDKLETYYINKYDSYNNGYNNDSGHHKTEDGKEEFIEILKNHNIEFSELNLISGE